MPKGEGRWKILSGLATISAIVLAALLTLYVLLLVGSPYGETAVCVAYDSTLLGFHRATGAVLGILTLATWIIGALAMRRTSAWARAARAVLIPVVIGALIAISLVVWQQAPTWLAVSDDASPACF